MNLNSPIINKIFEITKEQQNNLSTLLLSFVNIISTNNESDFAVDLTQEFKNFNESIEKIINIKD